MNLTFRRGRLGIVPTVLLLVLTVVTAISFRRVFDGWQFLPFFIALAVSVHLVSALCRVARLHSLLALPVGVLTTIGVIAQRMYPTTVRLGFLPSASTFRFAADDIRASWQEFSSSIAPVPARGGFLLVAALSIAVLAYTSDSFAMRAFGRVEAVIPSAVVFTFVSVLGETGHRTSRMWITAVWLFVACLTVALLRDDHGETTSTWLGNGRFLRAARVGTAAAVLSVIAVTVAYSVAPHLPGATAVGIIHPQDNDNSDTSVSTVSPLVDIRGRLTGHTNRVMFRVKASRPYYWHLTSLPDFDGKAWQSNETFSSTGGTLRAKPRGKSLRQTMTIENMGEGWVPAAFEAVAISGKNAFVYNPETATVRLSGDGNLTRGMTYTVNSVTGTYTAKQLSAATSRRPPDRRYLSLPDGFPDDLRSTAESVVEGKTSTYARAVALQNWFRENFAYDLSVRYGSGLKGMQEFLSERRGFCEQFASTFAAFARSIGIPARVAVGFTPGVMEGDEYVVRARNAHAWPEVWFDRIGWVSFEPTPGRGAPGSEGYTGVRPAQDETVEPDTEDSVPGTAETVPGSTTPITDGEADTVPGSPSSTAPSGASGPDSSDTSVPDDSVPSAPSGSGSGPAVLLWFLVVLGLGALGGAGYAWVRVVPVALRRRRLRLVGDAPADVVLHLWADATTLLGLVGVSRRPDETPLEHAERARTVIGTAGLDHDGLDRLAQLATRALYARETMGLEEIEASTTIVRELGASLLALAPRPVRWRLRLDPRLASRLV